MDPLFCLWPAETFRHPDKYESIPAEEFRPFLPEAQPELVDKAAKEAVQGVGFDVLGVCGLAFHPRGSEAA